MPGVLFQKNVPLAPFTTLKVGGPALYFVEAHTEDEAIRAVRFAGERGLEVFILGCGSNVVVSDSGFRGLVILNKITGFKADVKNNTARVIVGAGETLDDFVRRAAERGWAGIENLSGVPGTVGAAPVQNVGCYGQSVADTIVSVRAITIPNAELKIFNREDCKFRYRDSVFRSEESGRYFITEVLFELFPGKKANVSLYADIEKYFAHWSEAPTLQEVRRALLEIRAGKGMVIMPEYESYMSVGSFFKNPLVTADSFARIRESAESACCGKDDGSRWFWEEGGGMVKLSAARLMELSGFKKGLREGNVGISPKHALAIINYGGARADEIAFFAKKIRSAVMNRFGVELEPEARFVGRFVSLQ